jgi:hypothetical protein
VLAAIAGGTAVLIWIAYDPMDEFRKFLAGKVAHKLRGGPSNNNPE